MSPSPSATRRPRNTPRYSRALTRYVASANVISRYNYDIYSHHCCSDLQDRDGVINVHDLKKALLEMGEKVSEEELRELIAEVDINKNYTIEEEEFLQVLCVDEREGRA